MNIYDILKNLFTNPSSKWILEVEDKDIKPVLIQRYLLMHNATMRHAAVLNKFTFSLSPKMYLSSVWSLLFFNGKKMNKAPFIKYIKKNTDIPKYDFILAKVKRQFAMSDKDLKIVTPFLIKAIDKNKYEWFSYYGCNSQQWLEHNLNMDLMRKYGTQRTIVVEKQGLDKWL